MEIKTLGTLFEGRLDLIYLVQLLLVAPRDGECKVSRLIRLVTKHVLELESELVILAEKIVNLGEDPPPFFLSAGQHPENWL